MYDLIQAGENTYYIDCPAKAGIWRTDRGVYLIDSGGDKDAGKKLRQILEKKRLAPAGHSQHPLPRRPRGRKPVSAKPDRVQGLRPRH